MEKQGCVTTTYTDNDCNNAREDWRWWALKKANCSFLKKTVGFALIKADCVALIKADCIALKKADLFVLQTVGCVLRGAYASTRIGGSPM